MTEQPNEATALLKELVAKTNRTLESHAAALKLFNENLTAAHKVAANHSECLIITQENLKGLTELVNSQTRAFNVLRDVTVKLYEHCFGKDDLPDLPAVVN